jgi:hypothetical protein
MNIRLQIERLVLEGLPVTSAQGPLVKSAIEAELTRLLTARGLSQELRAGGAVPRVSATAFQVSSPNAPATIGRQIAHSVYGGIGTRK